MVFHVALLHLKYSNMMLFDDVHSVSNAGQLIGKWAGLFTTKQLEELEVAFATAKRDTFFPAEQNVFRIFKDVRPEKVRVVILGQDPYPNPNGQAIGYAFGCGVEMSPSLVKIREAIEEFVPEEQQHENPDMQLKYLIKQGVFLLNTSLTVVPGKIGSHSYIWQEWTRYVIEVIDNLPQEVVFLLWGGDAKKYRRFIKRGRVMEEEHPAYAARQHEPWICYSFNLCNNYLPEEKRILW